MFRILPTILGFILVTSCTSGIKNQLESSVGRDQNYHDTFLGNPVSIKSNDQGEIAFYELNEGKCKYKAVYDNNNIMTAYEVLSNSDECRIPVNWGGPW